MSAPVRLADVVAALGGELCGGSAGGLVDAGAVPISRLSPLESADATSLSFLSNPRYGAQLAASRAACVIVAPTMREAALAHAQKQATRQQAA